MGCFISTIHWQVQLDLWKGGDRNTCMNVSLDPMYNTWPPTINHNKNNEKIVENDHIVHSFGIYYCTSCNYRSNRRTNLTRHILIHTGEKPFACPFCNYRCITKVYLQEHIRTHTGEKPLVCPRCGYATAQASSLCIHMKKCSNQKQKL